MHNLMKYICDELDELDRKAKEGKLSMSETQYGDLLAHFKKNLLKSEEMMDDSEYSEYDDYSMNRGSQGRTRMGGRSYAMRGGPYDYDGGSYARGRRNAKRDSMGRYSRDEGFADELKGLMEEAPDEQTRMELRRMIEKMEMM